MGAAPTEMIQLVVQHVEQSILMDEDCYGEGARDVSGLCVLLYLDLPTDHICHNSYLSHLTPICCQLSTLVHDGERQKTFESRDKCLPSHGFMQLLQTALQ